MGRSGSTDQAHRKATKLMTVVEHQPRRLRRRRGAAEQLSNVALVAYGAVAMVVAVLRDEVRHVTSANHNSVLAKVLTYAEAEARE